MKKYLLIVFTLLLFIGPQISLADQQNYMNVADHTFGSGAIDGNAQFVNNLDCPEYCVLLNSWFEIAPNRDGNPENMSNSIENIVWEVESVNNPQMNIPSVTTALYTIPQINIPNLDYESQDFIVKATVNRKFYNGGQVYEFSQETPSVTIHVFADGYIPCEPTQPQISVSSSPLQGEMPVLELNLGSDCPTSIQLAQISFIDINTNDEVFSETLPTSPYLQTYQPPVLPNGTYKATLTVSYYTTIDIYTASTLVLVDTSSPSNTNDGFGINGNVLNNWNYINLVHKENFFNKEKSFNRKTSGSFKQKGMVNKTEIFK